METRPMAARVVSDPVLSPELVERVLSKLGLTDRPTLDLAGLNTLYAAFSGNVANDNIQKRIWFAGDHTTHVTGGNPTEFFENWLAHGTGGTCWPINGAMAALVQSLGFDARRIVGTMIVEGYTGPNHGSVLVALDGVDYLVDAQIAAFKALPLVPAKPASTGEGIHDISAAPIEGGFEVLWYTGHSREAPIPFHTETEHDPVDHAFFLAGYERSKSRELSPFNESLYICRHFRESILTIGRKNKITIAADGAMNKSEITDTERKRMLVDEFSLSEEIVEALPPDVPGGVAFF